VAKLRCGRLLTIKKSQKLKFQRLVDDKTLDRETEESETEEKNWGSVLFKD